MAVKKTMEILTAAIIAALLACATPAARAADAGGAKTVVAKPAAVQTSKKTVAKKMTEKTVPKKAAAEADKKDSGKTTKTTAGKPPGKYTDKKKPAAKKVAKKEVSPLDSMKAALKAAIPKKPKVEKKSEEPEVKDGIGIAHVVGAEDVASKDIMAALVAAPEQPAAGAVNVNSARVTRVEFTHSGAPDVWIDQGVMRGIIPAMSLEVISGNKVVGRIEIVKADSQAAIGAFSGACRMCLPKVGDSVKLSGKSFSLIPPAPINVPNAKTRLGAGTAADDEKLQASFRDFMSGKVSLAVETEPTLEPGPDLPDPTPKRELPRCPEATSVVDNNGGEQESQATSGLDEDIKAGYYLEHGDRVRIEGWPPYSPFCPAVDMNGYIRLPDVGMLAAARRTPASLETALRQKLAARGIAASPVLIPIPAEAMPATSEFFILGEVAGPGYYEFDTGVTTVEKAVEIAGGTLAESDGTAIVVDDLSKKWALRLVKLKEAHPAGQPEVGDRAVIFLPASREHLEQFIRDVLPYLSENQ
jgi:protein involved in polysaccharide export with SLBB domain